MDCYDLGNHASSRPVLYAKLNSDLNSLPEVAQGRLCVSLRAQQLASSQVSGQGINTAKKTGYKIGEFFFW